MSHKSTSSLSFTDMQGWLWGTGSLDSHCLLTPCPSPPRDPTQGPHRQCPASFLQQLNKWEKCTMQQYRVQPAWLNGEVRAFPTWFLLTNEEGDQCWTDRHRLMNQLVHKQQQTSGYWPNLGRKRSFEKRKVRKPHKVTSHQGLGLDPVTAWRTWVGPCKLRLQSFQRQLCDPLDGAGLGERKNVRNQKPYVPFPALPLTH